MKIITDQFRNRMPDLRTLAAFAMRSPGRLAAVVGVAAVAAIMLAHVLTPPATPATPTRPAEPAATSTGPASSAPPTITTPQGHRTTNPPARPASSARPTTTPTPVGPNVVDVAQLADQFVSTWADHTLTRDEWFTAVQPMITGRLAHRLRYTKPANVPARQVTGSAVVDPGPPITADVPTDAGTVRVVIVAAGQDYRVDRIM